MLVRSSNATSCNNVEILILPDGRIVGIYDDALVEAGIIDLGSTAIRRASHVEPADDGQWIVDLSPVGGPTLGPFRLRSEALRVEVEWLRERLGRLLCE